MGSSIVNYYRILLHPTWKVNKRRGSDKKMRLEKKNWIMKLICLSADWSISYKKEYNEWFEVKGKIFFHIHGVWKSIRKSLSNNVNLNSGHIFFGIALKLCSNSYRIEFWLISTLSLARTELKWQKWTAPLRGINWTYESCFICSPRYLRSDARLACGGRIEKAILYGVRGALRTRDRVKNISRHMLFCSGRPHTADCSLYIII